MADIELIVKIPEDIYKTIVSGFVEEYGFVYFTDKTDVLNAIKNGIPLSKEG